MPAVRRPQIRKTRGNVLEPSKNLPWKKRTKPNANLVKEFSDFVFESFKKKGKFLSHEMIKAGSKEVSAQEHAARMFLVKILNWMGIRNKAERDFLVEFFSYKSMSADFVIKNKELIENHKPKIDEVVKWADLFRARSKVYKRPRGDLSDILGNAANSLQQTIPLHKLL